MAELLSYTLDASGGGEAWELTKEQFRHFNDRSTPADVAESISALWLSPQAIRSAKVMCSALSVLIRCARADNALHDLAFGSRAKWIVVRRRNRIRQAVSLAMARKTNQYHVYAPVEDERPVDVSLQEIEAALRAVIMADCFLESFLTIPKVCCELFYEDVLADPAGAIRRALSDLGLVTDPKTFSFSEAKLVPERQFRKAELERSFRHWLLENNHRTE